MRKTNTKSLRTKKEILLIGFLFLLVVIFSYVYNYTVEQNNSPEKINEVCFNNECFSVEVVETPEERARGLMFRESLPENTGMLFIFEEEGVYPFWMKNTLISLDILWITKDKKVVFIKSNAAPCLKEECKTINPQRNAMYVLEINSGLAEKFNLLIGETVRFK